VRPVGVLADNNQGFDMVCSRFLRDIAKKEQNSASLALFVPFQTNLAPKRYYLLRSIS